MGSPACAPTTARTTTARSSSTPTATTSKRSASSRRTNMASIRREIRIDAPAAKVWDAVRDIGCIHKRLVPGFVADCRMEGSDARIVTFGNGLVVKEIIVDLDDSSKRLCWSAKSERLTH